MESAGGFTATKLIEARNILQNAISEIKASESENKVLNWLSFPACLMATGTLVSSMKQSEVVHSM